MAGGALARSGDFDSVVLDLTRSLISRRPVDLAEARKLADVAERAGGLLLLLTLPDALADGRTRLRTEARDGKNWTGRWHAAGKVARVGALPWNSLQPKLGLEDGGPVLAVLPSHEPDPLEDSPRE